MNPRNTARGLIPVACAFALALFSTACAAQAPDAASAASARRPFNVDDLFQLESLVENYGGPFAFSPDGQKLAIARVRAKATWTDYKLDFLGTAGADVWVQLEAGKPLRNITNGIEDGSGWWAPQWSPDGERLAMLSTRGGNVCLWVWEARTGRLRQVTTRGIALGLSRPFLWIDSQRLLYPALPPGEQPSLMKVEIETPEIATAMWPKARKGREVTASVLESGIPPPATEADELLILSLDGSSWVVARGRTRSWQVAPAGHVLVYARRIGKPPPDENSELIGGAVWDADVVEFAGREPIIHRSVAHHVLPHTLQWSADGKTLALLHYEKERSLLSLARVSADGTRTVRETLDDADTALSAHLAHRLVWLDRRHMLARFVPRGTSARTDWWVFAVDGSRECATCDMPSVPGAFVALPGVTGSLFGIASGDVWELQGVAGRVSNVTRSLDPEVQQIVPENPGPRTRKPTIPLLQFVAVDTNGVRTGYSWQPGAHAPHPLKPPAAGATARLFAASSRDLVWVSDDRNGLYVWRQSTAKGTELLVEGNQFLRGVEEAQARTFDYVAQDGTAQKAWLILPAGYREGRRYPLLTWVYAGATADTVPTSAWHLNNSSGHNLQVPAAAGYAVLIPSIPLVAQGTVGDPMLKLESGVIPAVDRAVELGIADPDRVFLMGHSFGGYTTLGLITQTGRFRAAVAMAGPSNLLSSYGLLDPRHRYRSDAPQRTLRQAMLESGQAKMGGAPWKDLDRYLRNSPALHVDRVATPVMIVMGDLDYVGIEQGEEFFMGLYRQGRRAQFVRYWGEGHVLQSPANIRDLWSRVFAWFDSFSAVSSGSPGQ